MSYLLMALAAYRLATLFVEDVGPLKVFQTLRLSGLNKALGQPLNCIRCMSVWCALFIYALPETVQTPLVGVLALSAGVLLLDLVRVWAFK